MDRLNPNDDLASVGQITSQDGGSKLVLQGDGNVVLYRANGVARWATATSNAVSAVMQGDGNFVLYSSTHSAVWSSATVGHPGAFLVLQDDGNLVIYDPQGTALWASNTMIISQQVPGFLPSSAGFHFSNSTFPQVPDITLNILGNKIPIGDASNGLCGGMVFAARDYFEAGVPIPSQTVNPTSGPLFDFIVKRLFDSFNLLLPSPPLPPVPGLFITPIPPFGPGPLAYMHLMDPALPDHETIASQIGASYHGRAWVMIVESWPSIKTDIDTHHLSPIALVELKSTDPTQMGMNHQVLVYGYSLDGSDLTLRLYDPNDPDNDNVVMTLSIAHPDHTTDVTNSVVPKVWCFFRPAYIPASPPAPPQGSWSELYTNADSLVMLDVARNVDGRVEVVGVNAPGNIWRTAQSPLGQWTTPGWGEVYSNADNLKMVRLGQNADGRLEVVGVNSAGNIWRTAQSAPGQWTNVGWSELYTNADRLVMLDVARNVDGRLEVVGVNAAGNIWRTAQSAPGQWPNGGWSELYTNADNLTMVRLGQNADGRLEVVGVNSAGNIWRTAQSAPGQWTNVGWSELYTNADRLVMLEIARNADGRLEVVGVNAAGNIWRTAQTAPGKW